MGPHVPAVLLGCCLGLGGFTDRRKWGSRNSLHLPKTMLRNAFKSRTVEQLDTTSYAIVVGVDKN